MPKIVPGPFRRLALAAVLAVAALPVILLPVAAQPFTFDLAPHNLDGAGYGDLAVADFDGDGRLDLALTGADADVPPYRSTAYIAFGRAADAPDAFAFDRRPLPCALLHGALAVADFDRDGHLDLVATGAARAVVPYEPRACLLRNDGQGGFTEVDAGLEGTVGGDAAWADFDGDGDPDLLLTGETATGAYRTALYRNDGDGRFVPLETDLPAVAWGDVAWADFDGDGDPDLFLGGADERGAFAVHLYRNEAGALVPGFILAQGLAFPAFAVADLDEDTYPDLAVAGGRLGPDLFEGVVQVFFQNRVFFGDGRTGYWFEPLAAPAEGALGGSLAAADFDADGRTNLLVAGALTGLGGTRGLLFHSDGGRRLTPRALVAGAAAARTRAADLDADLDLDLALSGAASGMLLNLYRNESRLVNTPPRPPAGLEATVAGSDVTLAWAAGADAETVGAAALTYAVRVGTAPGAATVVAPPADAATGQRRVAAPGEYARRLVLRGLAPGTYTWSVQTIDPAFVGSAWAAEGTFTVVATGGTATGADAPAAPAAAGLLPPFPNPSAGRVTLAFDLAAPALADVTVYDVAGRVVARLLRERRPAGRTTLSWDAAGLPAGVYFVRLRADGASFLRPLTLVD